MLTINGIVELIKQGEPDWVKTAREETRTLNVHINGIGVPEYLERIDQYENARQYELRKKYYTSNRFLFANLLRHVDKVFTAQGGSKFYGIKEAQKTEFLNLINEVRHGKSIRKWIQSVQANKYYSDPSGLVFFEWDTICYPTLKSITSIFNYKAKGRGVEWVIFSPEETKDGAIYRVVDARSDRKVLYKDNKAKVIDEYPNPWGYVPAIINSDKIAPTLDHFESPIQDVVELADKYLRTSSVKNIYEFLHGFPLFWAYAPKCSRCAGTGLWEGEECPVCNGDGNTFRKDVTDIIKLRPPSDSEEPKLAPDIAGYVEPADRTWRNQREELDWLWKLMHFTLWGTITVEKADRETALGRFMDIQPVNDRLNNFSDAFEDMEERMVQIMGKFYFPDYGITTINYGRIYMIESPDEIWKRYQDAKDTGAPKALLNYFLNQYYQSEFVNDEKKLLINQKAMRLEPFVHKTDEQVIGYQDNELKKEKIFFNEWFVTLSEGDMLTKSDEELKSLYNTYLQTKNLNDEQEVQGSGTETV